MKREQWNRVHAGLALAVGLALAGAAATAAAQETAPKTATDETTEAERGEATVEAGAEGSLHLTEGLVVVRDPESGEVRQASGEEIREMRRQLRLDRKESQKAAKLEWKRHANGMDSVVLNESFMVFTIVERDADGRYVIVKHGKGPELPELPNTQPPER